MDKSSKTPVRKTSAHALQSPVAGQTLTSKIMSNRPSSAHTTGNINQHNDEEIMTLHSKVNQLEKDLERRQESYITRERAYKVRIDELEEELARQRESKTGWMKSDSKMSKLKNMHRQILNNVELVQDRTARILQEQERDLLRAFRARLFDVQTELEKEKNKKDDGAAAWIERSRQLEAEVEWAKEVADRLERVNQTLLQENNRLKSQFTSQEEDRSFLIKQLVTVKKDNAKLRAEYGELESENDKLKQEMVALREKLENNAPVATSMVGKGVTGVALNAMTQHKIESEERYKELYLRLRRLLAEDRKSLQQLRQNYANELKVRTDMEMLLRQAVEDVRKEIARRYVEEGQFSNTSNDLAKLYGKQPSLIPVEDFTQGDRERVLELLLSQERVVSLIYAKTFPINPSNNKNVSLEASSNNLNLNTNGLEFLEGELDFQSPTGEHRPSTSNAMQQGNTIPNNTSGTNTNKLPAISGSSNHSRVVSR